MSNVIPFRRKSGVEPREETQRREAEQVAQAFYQQLQGHQGADWTAPVIQQAVAALSEIAEGNIDEAGLASIFDVHYNAESYTTTLKVLGCKVGENWLGFCNLVRYPNDHGSHLRFSRMTAEQVKERFAHYYNGWYATQPQGACLVQVPMPMYLFSYLMGASAAIVSASIPPQYTPGSGVQILMGFPSAKPGEDWLYQLRVDLNGCSLNELLTEPQ